MTESNTFSDPVCNRWIDEVRGLRCALADGHPGLCRNQTTPPRVAHPNWSALGFAGPEDAEGRN